MEHEYKRDERLAGGRLIYDRRGGEDFAKDAQDSGKGDADGYTSGYAFGQGGSCARVVREDEIDPAELRRKQAEDRRSEYRYIDMFCERYRDRGIAGRVHADAARQEKKEALTRAIAPGAYIGADELAAKEKKLDSYRSGRSRDGKRYMTVEDFTRYYHDQRGYKFPQYRIATDEERAAAVKAMTPSGEMRLEQPKKAVWLTDTDKLPLPLAKLLSRPFFVRLNEWAQETFPREREMRIETHPVGGFRPRRIPVGLVAAIVTVMVSMATVITSTVLVSQATRELSQTKQAYYEMRELHGELKDQLDLKNDMLAIEDYASNELGMVHEKYLRGEYLTEEKEDSLEILDKDRDGGKKGLAWLLSAFGIGE